MRRQLTTNLRQHRTICLLRSIRSACVFGAFTASCISSNCRSRFSSITRSDSHLTYRTFGSRPPCGTRKGHPFGCPFLVHRTNLNPNRYPNRSPAKRVRFGKGRRTQRMCSFRGSFANRGNGTELSSSDVVHRGNPYPNRSRRKAQRSGFATEKEEGTYGYAAFLALTETREAEWSKFLLTWYR